MRFDVVTIFPEFFDGPLDYGIVRRARSSELIEVHVEDLREFTQDRHRTVDDRPFGGGEGMVMKPEPLFEAVEAITGAAEASSRLSGTAIVLLSASGKLFNQNVARRFSHLDRVVLICGRYEGVDERVAEHLATDEISIGDFVLTGGELPAAMIIDAVTRLLPGALGNEDSAIHESFSAENAEPLAETGARGGKNSRSVDAATPDWLTAAVQDDNSQRAGILDFPHFTRPAEFRGWPIPDILIGGNHEEIRKWRRRAALEKTLRNRPELLAHANLSLKEMQYLEELNSTLTKRGK
jgi:tRNA (guanine37-N1)-methyltransferase